MKTLVIAAVASAFSLGAVAASHMEKAASGAMAKPAAAASAPMAKASAPMKAKKMKKSASAPA